MPPLVKMLIQGSFLVLACMALQTQAKIGRPVDNSERNLQQVLPDLQSLVVNRLQEVDPTDVIDRVHNLSSDDVYSILSALSPDIGQTLNGVSMDDIMDIVRRVNVDDVSDTLSSMRDYFVKNEGVLRADSDIAISFDFNDMLRDILDVADEDADRQTSNGLDLNYDILDDALESLNPAAIIDEIRETVKEGGFSSLSERDRNIADDIVSSITPEMVSNVMNNLRRNSD